MFLIMAPQKQTAVLCMASLLIDLFSLSRINIQTFISDVNMHIVSGQRSDPTLLQYEFEIYSICTVFSGFSAEILPTFSLR